LRPSALFERTNIIHITSSVSWRLKILCIMFKNMAFFILTLFTLLYWRLEFYSHVVISCMTGSFHWEGKLGTINSVYLHHIFLKCLYQVREVSCHVYVCKLSCICVYHFRLDFGSFPTVLNCLDFNLYSSFKSGTFVFQRSLDKCILQ
jgi:hypothetical protein